MRVKLLYAALALLAFPAAAETRRPDQTAFLDIYRELIEIDTAHSAGDCTLAAQKMAARLHKAGFSADEARVFTPPDHPKEGGLIARLPGRDASAPAMLLLAHLDVVEANPSDWSRPPFTLTEDKDFFYGRGVVDDKHHVAIWIDSLIRFRQDGFKPRRTIKLALTCGEEGVGLNGADWLIKNDPGAVKAAFALNEGGGGQFDAAGKPLYAFIEVGEKSSRAITLETTNPGGHSSRPVAKNAIYDMAAALTKIGTYRFPLTFSPTTRGYFAKVADVEGGEMGRAMKALVANPKDTAAEAIVIANPTYNAMLRTTCVATMIDGGHAPNALPQRVRATVNCRILPEDTLANVRATLIAQIANPDVAVTSEGEDQEAYRPPSLDPAIIKPAETIAAKIFPNMPLIPTLLIAATDGARLSAAGIPTYGVPGIFLEPDMNGAHGRDEHIRISSLFNGRDYMYELVKAYAR